MPELICKFSFFFVNCLRNINLDIEFFKPSDLKITPCFFCIIMLFGIFICHAPLFAQKVHPTKHLPVMEYRSTGDVGYYVIFLSGNGGLRNLVQSVTHYLNSKNVSVIALNSKKYFWSKKMPEQIGCDLESLMDQCNLKWGEKKVVIIGFSMGAEVLPFAVNCMADKYRNEINDMILIAPWQKATFKVKLRDFYLEVNEGSDIYSELIALKPKKAYVICDNNHLSICHKDLDGLIDHDLLGGGHHFGGHYSILSQMIGKRLNLQ